MVIFYILGMYKLVYRSYDDLVGTIVLVLNSRFGMRTSNSFFKEATKPV